MKTKNLRKKNKRKNNKNKTKTKKYKRGGADGDEDTPTCMVCLENAEELSNKEPPATLAKTPCCNQDICTECFRGLNQPKKCPMCRKSLYYLNINNDAINQINEIVNQNSWQFFNDHSRMGLVYNGPRIPTQRSLYDRLTFTSQSFILPSITHNQRETINSILEPFNLILDDTNIRLGGIGDVILISPRSPIRRRRLN
jgi:hypothetical protein